MAGKNVHEFNDDNFDSDVIQAAEPVLVDFWAEWCRPCLELAPIIDDLASVYNGKVKVGKVDTDSNREISMRFQITAIPTVILFQGGKIKKKFVGLTSKKQFQTALDELVA